MHSPLYDAVITAVGHTTKISSMAYAPAVLSAGIILYNPAQIPAWIYYHPSFWHLSCFSRTIYTDRVIYFTGCRCLYFCSIRYKVYQK